MYPCLSHLYELPCGRRSAGGGGVAGAVDSRFYVTVEVVIVGNAALMCLLWERFKLLMC
jgi:hypothetical protein